MDTHGSSREYTLLDSSLCSLMNPILRNAIFSSVMRMHVIRVLVPMHQYSSFIVKIINYLLVVSF